MQVGFTNTYFPSYLSGTDDEKIGMEFQNSDHEQRYSDSVNQTRITFKKKRYIKTASKQNEEVSSDSDYIDEIVPLTEEEIKKLFTFDTASVFSEIVNDDEALQYYDTNINNDIYDDLTTNKKKKAKQTHVNTAPSFRYSIVPKHVKSALRRTIYNQLPFLMTMEYICTTLLLNKGTITNSIKEHLTRLGENRTLKKLTEYPSTQIILTFDDPYHVFLAAGLASYYYMSSRLFTHPKYPNGIVILRLNPYSSLSSTYSLYDFIVQELEDEQLIESLPRTTKDLYKEYQELVAFQDIPLETIKQSGIKLTPTENSSNPHSKNKKKKKYRRYKKR